VIPIAQQGFLALSAAFLVAHALADFPLQGEYLARQKSRQQADSRADWIVALASHSVIHAGGVWLVSGSLAFAAAEFILHCMIDLGKGECKYGLAVDQILHLICKLAYAWILVSDFPR
jgi:hypothetical protein